MRLSLAATAALALAPWLAPGLTACGGSASGPAAATAPAADTTAAAAPGTTGYPGLDWGLDVEQVRARHPAIVRADPEDLDPEAGLAYWSHATTHDGEPATITFGFTEGALSEIRIRLARRYPSIEACRDEWQARRARIDQVMGPSGEDNLMVEWKAATYELWLSCNWDDEQVTWIDLRYGPYE